jgi:hypothetical protein
MKRLAILFSLMITLGFGNAWASAIGTTDPTQFNDMVTWGQWVNDQTFYSTAQNWTSNNNWTGTIGGTTTAHGWNISGWVQGTDWAGPFATGEQLVYNNVELSTTPTDLLITFNTPVYGAGAYIAAAQYGAFTATATVYDKAGNMLGSYSTGGTSAYDPSTAPFIGLLDSNQEISSIDFNVSDINGNNDFAIGTMYLSDTQPIPEPCAMLLLGSGLLGIGAYRMRKPV